MIDDSWLLTDVAQAALARAGAERWSVEPGEFWCMVSPPVRTGRAQGWKLHVSTTLLAAPLVLSRVVPVLAAAGCAFKFARDLARVGELGSNQVPRGSGGKFVTAYPDDDDHFRALAADLARATDGLPGPLILSDRPVRQGGIVHYRYGAFHAERVLTNEGAYVSRLIGPDGAWVPDERGAWFNPPPWAPLPLLDDTTPSDTTSGDTTSGGTTSETAAPDSTGPVPGEPVLLGDRFEVRETVRHSYRGGVFRAVDRQGGAVVIVKQARPHVMSTAAGTDARDALRGEAGVLDRLGPLGLAPRQIALFEQQGNLFLAEELVPGVTLRDWAAERAVGQWRGQGAPVGDAVGLAGQLVEIVAGVHRAGLVLCDLSPNNVMVTPEDRLRLVDLEDAKPLGERCGFAMTRGYAGPERYADPVAAPEADLYSVGATILYLASALHPALPADEPGAPPPPERLAGYVTRLAADLPAVRHLAPLILGLTDADPARRWDLDRAREFLAGPPAAAAGPDPAGGLPGEVADRLLADGLAHLARTVIADDHELWPQSADGQDGDPWAVQHGAAGVLAVLARATAVLPGAELRATVQTAAGWLGKRPLAEPWLLPGLYHGRAGTAWALYEAAMVLGEDSLAGQAIGLARQLPLRWPNPDVCHGAAGAGLALLHLWQASGDPDLLDRAVQAADGVLAAAQERGGRLLWPIPADFDSTLAGCVHYGFGHGVAGIGAFLLYAGLATGRADYADAARRAGDTLCAAVDGADGAAWWPAGPAPEPVERLRHWCSGSSGIGTFLIRLWAVSGEPVYRELAGAAAVAVHRDRWYSLPAACHGLPSDGDYLLDLAALTGEQRYRDWAADLAAVIHSRHAVRDGLLLPADLDSPLAADHSNGLSGVLGFLLRLRHGGPRWWLPDSLLPTTTPAPQEKASTA